ncbi:MAG: hypothetical protein ABSF95_12845 [Verrucomicrobiota bacterium]
MCHVQKPSFDLKKQESSRTFDDTAPWGVSMFTGIAEEGVYPHHPHLMASQLTGRPVLSRQFRLKF